MIEEDVVQKILKLANELEFQQQSNQEAAASIKLQLSDIKQRAKNQEQEIAGKMSAEQVHEKAQAYLAAGDETIHSLATKYIGLFMEHEAVVSRKQQLERECNNLQTLARDYENGLNVITNKLRNHTHKAIHGHVQLQQEYEALLDAEKRTTSALFIENTMLQTQLRRLSRMLRERYEAETNDGIDSQLVQLTMENRGLREMLQVAQGTLPQELLSNATKNSAKHEPNPPFAQTEAPRKENGALTQYFNNEL